MAVHSQKLRTLYLMNIMLEKTDEEHMLNASQLCGILKQEYGMDVDRRTIYSEMDILDTFGLNIIQKKGKNPGYYVGSRQFELPELKLLVDAVQSSKFITEKKSRELIGKLEGLCSEAEAGRLARQVVISNRPKTGNETIYYNVDRIHTAIFENRQIGFQYGEWTPKKELKLKKDGARYVVSPWSLTWTNENYYLIAYDEGADKIKHYRVDKMKGIVVLELPRKGEACFRGFDPATFTKKTFGMYGGKDAEVFLRCTNDLAGVLIDRFGQDIWMRPDGAEHFCAKVQVAVSSQFFGWVTGVGKKLKITGPEDVKKEYEMYLREILREIEEDESKKGNA